MCWKCECRGGSLTEGCISKFVLEVLRSCCGQCCTANFGCIRKTKIALWGHSSSLHIFLTITFVLSLSVTPLFHSFFLLSACFWSAFILCWNQSGMLYVFYLLSLWGLEGSEDTVWHPGKVGTARKQLVVIVEETEKRLERTWSWKLLTSNRINSLVGLDVYTRSQFCALAPFGFHSILHTVFAYRKRQCRCFCVCASVCTPVGGIILYTHSRRQMRCNTFHSVKTNKARVQSELLVSALSCPKVCQNECFPCQQKMQTVFGDIWGYCEGS